MFSNRVEENIFSNFHPSHSFKFVPSFKESSHSINFEPPHRFFKSDPPLSRGESLKEKGFSFRKTISKNLIVEIKITGAALDHANFEGE